MGSTGKHVLLACASLFAVTAASADPVAAPGDAAAAAPADQAGSPGLNAATPPGQSDTGLAEIVVTANRRSENLQKVPIAVTAITAANAKALGITDAQSLVHSVPGLQFDRQAGASTPYIRGIGNSVGQAGDEPAVAFYVDDVYYPAGAASLQNFASVDSLEVAKGPQGTLFGRNATGGVVQVFTKNPSHTQHLDLQVGYANYKTPSGNFYYTGPLTDTLAFNVTGYGSKQYDGWGHNQCAAMYASLGCTTTGKTFTGYDYGGRAKLEWKPGDDTTFLLIGDYDMTRTEEGLGFHPFNGSLIAPFTPDGGLAAGFKGIPGPPGKYDDVQDENSYIKIRQGGVSLKATHDFDFAKLISISAWRQTFTYERLDNDASPLVVFDTYLRSHEKTFTQELQLQSQAGGSLTWIVGAYYMHDMASAPYTFFGAGLGALSPAITEGKQTTDSYSAFAQTTFKPFADTHITLGVRYTIDRREFTDSVFIPSLNIYYHDLEPTAYGTGSLPAHKTFKNPTARASIDHNFGENFLIYAAYNRGFKSGLWNTTTNPGVAPAPVNEPVKPETVDAYTAGFKSEFLDHRLRLNVEGFYYKYQNLQVDNVKGTQTILQNAAKATIKGVDVDITAKPITNFTANLSIEYLSAHYDQYDSGVLNVYDPIYGGNRTPTGALAPSLSGNKLPESPPFTLTLSGNYRIPLEAGKVDLTGTFFHGGNYYFSADNGAAQPTVNWDKQPTLNLLGGTIAFTTKDDKYTISVWGKNLTNKLSYSFVIHTPFSSYYSPAPPRTYGVTLQAHF